MAAKKIRLDIPPGMRGGTIEIDGQPVRGVRGINVEASVYEIPKVTLDVVVKGIDLDCLAHVDVPEKTRETLIALGWTPPVDEAETVAECLDRALARAKAPSDNAWTRDWDNPEDAQYDKP